MIQYFFASLMHSTSDFILRLNLDINLNTFEVTLSNLLRSEKESTGNNESLSGQTRIVHILRAFEDSDKHFIGRSGHRISSDNKNSEP